MAIERNEFLKMCQKVSILKESGNVKQNVPTELLVKFGNILYYPVAYELSFEMGQPKHTAILHDLHANAIFTAELGKVKKND